jgi:hypothetical protein
MPVSAAHKKICSNLNGRYLCSTCAATSGGLPGAGSVSREDASADPEDALAVLAKLMPGPDEVAGISSHQASKSVRQARMARRAMRPDQTTVWIFSGAVILAALLSTYVVVNRQTWEDLNRTQIESMKTAAESLLQTGQPKPAYDRYKDLFAFVGEHEIKSLSLRDDLDIAKAGMESARAAAAPLIAKEEAERKAQEAERARLLAAAEERDRQAREAAARQAAARAQEAADAQERERTARAAAVEHALRATQRTLILKSDQFADWKRSADSIVSDLDIQLIGEDSVYRGMSKRAKAARNLLALCVKAEARIRGANVDASVDRVLSSVDIDLIGEDSAIRDLYKNDMAFFHLLGPWCLALDGNKTVLRRIYQSQESSTSLQGLGDDSAVRAIASYSEASMQVLRAIASEQGLGSKADAIVADVQTSNVSDDSAWRVAMRNEDGNMRLLLSLVAREDPVAAAKIQTDQSTATIGDDSALRAQEAYLQGKVDALHWLVYHP